MLLDEATPGPRHRRASERTGVARSDEPTSTSTTSPAMLAADPRADAAGHGVRRWRRSARPARPGPRGRRARPPPTAGPAALVVAGHGRLRHQRRRAASPSPAPAAPVPLLTRPRRHPPRLGRPARPGRRRVLLGTHRGDAARRDRGRPPGLPPRRRRRRRARRCSRRVAAAAGRVPAGRRAGADAPRLALDARDAAAARSAAALGAGHVADDDLRRRRRPCSTRSPRANGVEVPVATNEAKTLGLRLAGRVAHGLGRLAARGGRRVPRSPASSTRTPRSPASGARSPRSTHNQIVAFDGRYGARDGDDDLFRDPELDGPAPARAQLVLLRDPERRIRGTRSAASWLRELATDRGMRPLRVAAAPGHAVTRLASLVALAGLGQRLRRPRPRRGPDARSRRSPSSRTGSALVRLEAVSTSSCCRDGEVPLGGTRDMTVRRSLPHRDRRTVGAWCFVDHYGPAAVGPAWGMDVPPHPHTGLQTVSWLLAGEVRHRDSLGSDVRDPARAAQPDDQRATASRTRRSRSAARHPARRAAVGRAARRAPRPGAALRAPRGAARRRAGRRRRARCVVGDYRDAPRRRRRTPRSSGSTSLLHRTTRAGRSTPEFEHAVLLVYGAAEVDGEPLEVGSLLYLGAGRVGARACRRPRVPAARAGRRAVRGAAVCGGTSSAAATRTSRPRPASSGRRGSCPVRRGPAATRARRCRRRAARRPAQAAPPRTPAAPRRIADAVGGRWARPLARRRGMSTEGGTKAVVAAMVAQRRHRGHQVRRVRASPGRARCSPRRSTRSPTPQPGPAADRWQARQAGRRRRAPVRLRPHRATSTPSSSRSSSSCSAACSPSTRACTRSSTPSR